MKRVNRILDNMSVVLAVFGACVILSIIGGAYIVSSHVQSNCQNVHTLYQAIERVLQESDGRIQNSKTLTHDQIKEYLDGNQRNKVILSQGDCH